MFTTCLPLKFYDDFFRRSKAIHSAVKGLIWPYFELIQDFIVVHVNCKNKEDPIKNEVDKVFITFFPFYHGGYLLPWKPEF